MSASQKLRELDRSIHHDPEEVAKNSEWKLIDDALPEIIAVVEAAEHAGQWISSSVGAEITEADYRTVAGTLEKLLAALEKKL